MITLRAANDEYRGTKKASIGRVTGRDPKWGLALEWVGQRSGGTDVEHITDEPGLYQLRSYDRKGRQSEVLTLVFPDAAGELAEWGMEREEAMKVAKAMDDGRPLTDIIRIVPAVPHSPLYLAVAQAAEHRRRVAEAEAALSERVPAKGLPMAEADGYAPKAAVIAHRLAEIERLDAEIAARRAAGEPETAGHAEQWEIVTAKQAEAAKAAAGVEEAIAACRTALGGLTVKQQKEVLAQLKKMFTPAKPSPAQPEQV